MKGMTAGRQAGLKVFRTWGFNDKNVTFDPQGLPQYGGEGAGGTEVVFQWWANGTSTIDVTPFDTVVDAATGHWDQTHCGLDQQLYVHPTIRLPLIVPARQRLGLAVVLTVGQGADYGGTDVYTTNLGGRYHDDVSCPLAHSPSYSPCGSDHCKYGAGADLWVPRTSFIASQNQGSLQVLREGNGHTVQRFTIGYGLGAEQRASLRC